MFSRTTRAGLAGLLLLAASPALAIEGLYTVEGKNPGQPGGYKGEAQIKQTGRTYTIVWRIGEGQQIGTGILIDNVLSIVFTAPGPGAAGPGGLQRHRRQDHERRVDIAGLPDRRRGDLVPRRPALGRQAGRPREGPLPGELFAWRRLSASL